MNFYCIQLRQNDIKRDLVENMVTNMVLTDEIYVIMFRLYSELYDDDIQMLKCVQDNQALLDSKVNLASLQVNKEFQMDLDFRDTFDLKTCDRFASQASIVRQNIPYNTPIKNLSKIDEIESPMCKLEHIYKCCTVEIQKSLDKFWRNHEITSKKLSVDVDNLQSLIVYLISRLKCP